MGKGCGELCLAPAWNEVGVVNQVSTKLLEGFYVDLFKLERQGGSNDLGQTLSCLDQEFLLKGDPYGVIPFVALLTLSEKDPQCLLRAIISRVLRGDHKGFQTALQVVSIRRDDRALHFASITSLATKEDLDLIRSLEPWVPNARPLPATKGDLETFASSVGATTLRIFAQPTPSDPYTRPVALVVYPSGELGVIKQVMCEQGGPLGPLDLEQDILSHLVKSGYPFLDPNFQVGTEGGHTFLQRPFLYGSPLSQTAWEGCGKSKAREIVARVAEQLEELHQRGVLLLDLGPDNILSDGTLFDFGHSRMLPSGESNVPTFVMDPVFTPPEVVLTRRAGREADIFALGVLYHKLIFRTHPFPNGPVSFGGELAYALPNTILPYEGGGDEDSNLIQWMLEKDPTKRPTAGKVLAALRGLTKTEDSGVLQRLPKFRSLNTVPVNPGTPVALVPMRCGVPHKGHINLICKLMDLGYFVQVSLQMAYTWTDSDPLPKWLVSRMLQSAVKERGYPLADMDVVLTPFETKSSIHMHFLMLPVWEDVQVVVSGNPEVESLLGPILGDRIFLRSQDFCGDLSDANGTRLRTAMLTGDQQTVEAMLPPAVAREWPDLLSMFPKKGDIQVQEPVAVYLQVEDPFGGVLRTLRVRRYEHPEKALARMFPGVQLSSWACGPIVVLRGSTKATEFTYVGQVYDTEEGNLFIRYATDQQIG